MARPLDVAGMRVYTALVRSRPGTTQERLCHKLRGLLVRLGDPTVTFDVAGMPLRLPLSHDLPLYLSRFPLYSGNLGRLAAACAGAYPDLAVVDIGANVGDSAAFLRQAGVAEILCVEGHPRYLAFLRTNAAALGDGVTIAPVLVGAATGPIDAPFLTAKGTGGFRGGAPAPTPALTVSLDDLLAEHPRRGRLKLVKSDTDGFEAHILKGGIASLRKDRPVLFFEYDPSLLAANGSDGLQLLTMLRKEAAYATAMVYDNFGDLLLSVRLDDVDVLEELHRYVEGKGGRQYLDIAAFHADDDDLFQAFRAREHDFYRSR